MAGIVAALVTGVYHFAFTEPVLQRAIDYEHEASLAAGDDEDELVSRSAQRVGLFVGVVIFGLAWCLISAAIYFALQLWLPAWSAVSRVAFLAVSMYWSVGLFPFLKYPANPPGVGETDSLTERQSLYFSFMALSVLVTGLAFYGSRLAEKRGFLGLTRNARYAATAAALAILAACLYLAMPANPDPVEVPSDIVNSFRRHSLAGLTLFWACFGLGFGALLSGAFAGGASKYLPRWLAGGSIGAAAPPR